MRGDPRHAEVVADAADAEDQRVVRQDAGRQNLFPVVVEHGREPELAVRAIEPRDGSDAEPEIVPVRHQEVVGRVQVGVEPPGSDLVQERLP